MALWEPTIYLILLIILQYEAVATGGECSYCKNWHRGNNSAELCFFQGSNFITVGCKNSVSMRNRMQEVSICHLLGKQDENDERGYDCFKVYMLEEDKCIFITVFNLKVLPLRRVNHLNANDMFGCLCYPNEYLRVSEFGFRVVVRRFLHLKLKRSKRSCRYYSNSCSTFNVLLKAGDIEMNPGPSAPKCSICEKSVRKNMRRFVCEVCKDVSHANCTEIAWTKSIRADYPHPWTCSNCTVSILPFNALDRQAFMAAISAEESDVCQSEFSHNDTNIYLQHLEANKNHLKIMHLNTQSMCSTFNEFQLIVQTYIHLM